MNRFVILMMFASIWTVERVIADDTKDNVEPTIQARFRPILDAIAAEHELVGESDSKPLELVEGAKYSWAHPGPNDGNFGSIYVWTNQGNAEAVACFWYAKSDTGQVTIFHEMHSLSTSVLTSSKKGVNRWTTNNPLQRQLVPDAPVPATSAAGRLSQMRTICKNFSATTVSPSDERVELRLLPQPIYRFNSTNPDLLDGALFAFVCSVGTDPELFLQLEAVKTESGFKWRYAPARFSHLNLFVSYDQKEVWKAIRDEKNPVYRNSDLTYFMFSESFDPARLNNRETK